MTKQEIINKIYITYDAWECGYTRNQLETLTKKRLLRWLKNLESKGPLNENGR